MRGSLFVFYGARAGDVKIEVEKIPTPEGVRMGLKPYGFGLVNED